MVLNKITDEKRLADLDSLPPEVAQKIASHTSLKTTRIYQVNQDKRDREELKKLNFLKVV